MANVSSLGVGTGLDLNSVLSSLMAAEKQPLTRLETRITTANSKISTFGRLKAKLDVLLNAATKLSSSFNLSAMSAKSSDDKISTATAAFNAPAGSYALSVSQLASAQKSFSNAQASGTTFGQGTLNFTIDGELKSVDLTDQASYTLQDVRAKINAANIGVSATVISGTAGDRLVLTGTETGAAGAFTLAVADGTTDAPAVGLSALQSFDEVTVGLARTTAQDAVFTVDGVAATSSTNNVTTAVNGLTINLLTTGSSTLTVETDNTKIKDALKAFVDAYNDINTLIKENANYDSAAKKAQPLNGEMTIRNIQSVLSSTRSSVPAALSGATYQTLSALGVSIGKDGSLSMDESKLQTALSTSSADALQTLNAYGTAFKDSVNNILDSDGIIQSRIDGLNAQLKSYNDNKTSLQVRLNLIEQRYRAQFTALDRITAQLQVMSGYIGQQFG